MTSSFLQTLYRFYQIHYQILYQNSFHHSKNNFETLPNPNTFYGPGLTRDFRLTKPIKLELLSLWTPTATEPMFLHLFTIDWASQQTPRHDLEKVRANIWRQKPRSSNLKNPCPRIRKAALLLIKQRFFWLLCAFLTIKHLTRQNAKKRRFSWLLLHLFSYHSSYTNKRQCNVCNKRNITAFN